MTEIIVVTFIFINLWVFR